MVESYYPTREPSGIFGFGSKVMPVPAQVLQHKAQDGWLYWCIIHVSYCS